MTERPFIKSGDWIRIGSVDCVVSLVRPPGDSFGDCEVVFNAQKPTNDEARWANDHWEFVSNGATGGLADRYPRLADFVWKLKRGK